MLTVVAMCGRGESKMPPEKKVTMRNGKSGDIVEWESLRSAGLGIVDIQEALERKTFSARSMRVLPLPTTEEKQRVTVDPKDAYQFADNANDKIVVGATEKDSETAAKGLAPDTPTLQVDAKQQMIEKKEDEQNDKDSKREEAKDHHRISGLWGTLAPQQDEAHYDVRSDAEDDLEKGHLKFPRNSSPIMNRASRKIRDSVRSRSSTDSRYSKDFASRLTISEDEEYVPYEEEGDCSVDIQNNDRNRLYGRQEELDQLNEIFNDIALEISSSRNDARNTSDGDGNFGYDTDDSPSARKPSSSRVVFLSGYSGVGKSALVEEFVHSLKDDLPEYVFYAPGKFHSQNRSSLNTSQASSSRLSLGAAAVPFSAISHAFQKGVQDLLEVRTESVLRGRLKKSTSVRAWATMTSKTRIGLDSDKSDIDLLGSYGKSGNAVGGDGSASGELSNAKELLKSTFPSISAYLSLVEGPVSHDSNTSGKNLQRNVDVIDESANKDDSNEDLECECGDDGISDLDDCDDHDPYDQDEMAQHQFINMTGIKEGLLQFFSLLGRTMSKPIILFLDDMQWADGPSLELLYYLACEKRIQNVMFIFAYRSNVVTEDHPLQLFIDSVKTTRESRRRRRAGWRNSRLGAKLSITRALSAKPLPSGVDKIELTTLPPEEVRLFIADTLSKPPEQIESLSNIVYQLTLGNIFYVTQVMEQMVISNALYFDVMTYEWRWNSSKMDVNQFQIGGNVEELIHSKVGRLSREMLALLAVMAFVPKALNKPTIQSFLWSEGICLNPTGTTKLLDQATKEGMILYDEITDEYCIANNQVREVVSSMVPEGEPQYELFVRISKVLQNRRRGKIQNNWMNYVVVDLLNSVPAIYTDQMELVKLNLRVGNQAWSKGILESACEMWRNGLSCLDATNNKWSSYSITLSLCNNVVMGEFFMGNYWNAKSVIEDIIGNAKPEDKFTAYKYKILCAAGKENENYEMGLKEGVTVLNTVYGLNILSQPTPFKKMNNDIFFSSFDRKTMSSMIKLHPAEDESVFHMLAIVSRYAAKALCDDKLFKIIKLTIQQANRVGISKFIPEILLHYAVSLVRKDKASLIHWRKSQMFCETALAIAKIFENDVGRYAAAQFQYWSNILSRLEPHGKICDALHTPMLTLKKVGYSYLALDCSLNYFSAYLAAGLPLDPRFESQLFLMEEYSRSTDHGELSSRLKVMLKYVTSLRKKTNHRGAIGNKDWFDELTDDSADDFGSVGSFRDTKIYRIMHAFLFGDEDLLNDLLRDLDDFPVKGMNVTGIQCSLCLLGLAAFSVQGKNKKYSKLGKKVQKYFEQLKKLGSGNVLHVCLLLEAVKSANRAAYDIAIDECRKAKTLNLQAIACEHCGILMKRRGDEVASKEYITKSYYLYKEWRAFAKTDAMMRKYEFL